LSYNFHEEFTFEGDAQYFLPFQQEPRVFILNVPEKGMYRGKSHVACRDGTSPLLFNVSKKPFDEGVVEILKRQSFRFDMLIVPDEQQQQ
jgi:hypothetical protein